MISNETKSGQARKPLDDCRREFAAELERGDLRLPMLPQIVRQVMEICNQPDADISGLGALIQRDPSLAGHVLRAANSAALGARQSITSLQQALTQLGMRFVADAAFAVAMRADIFTLKEFAPEAAAIWRHALASAAFGREVARLKRVNVEGQYLCGLLHTVGKPVALQKLSEISRRERWELSRADMVLLAEEFHRQLGVRLMMEWKLPSQLAAACRWYSHPGDAADFQEEVALTFLSGQLAAWLLDGKPTQEELSNHPILEFLNIYPDELSGLFEKHQAIKESISGLEL